MREGLSGAKHRGKVDTCNFNWGGTVVIYTDKRMRLNTTIQEAEKYKKKIVVDPLGWEDLLKIEPELRKHVNIRIKEERK